MACDTRLKPQQSLQQRAEEVRRAVAKIDALLASGRAKTKIGPQGAVAFVGLAERERDSLTDACIYRRIMTKGSALARASITRAEQLAGRTADRAVIGQGVHSHDSGRTWHNQKG